MSMINISGCSSEPSGRCRLSFSGFVVLKMIPPPSGGFKHDFNGQTLKRCCFIQNGAKENRQNRMSQKTSHQTSLIQYELGLHPEIYCI